MAGTIKWQEGAALTLTNAGVQLASGQAGLASTLDCRVGGTAGAIEAFAALFSLSAAWVTVTGIAAGTTVADLYLVPAIDGATFPDLDLTAASYIPYTMRVGLFVASKVPTTTQNALFQSAPVDLMPVLYNVYVLNRSGQTISSGWTLKALNTAVQYT